MKPKICISLEFLHLENAIFCAEQSVSAGVSTLEIGSTLLKNTGLTSIKVLRERFPRISLVADMKIQNNVEFEIKAIADAGANAVTISGSASHRVWEKSIEVAQNYNIETILDFREILHAENYMRNIPEKFDLLMLSIMENDKVFFHDLQKLSSCIKTPIGVKGAQKEDDIIESVSMGASTICISFSDTKEQNIQDVAKNAIKTLSDSKKTFPKNPIVLHEQQLMQILDQISPNDICEVYDSPCFISNVYPIQKYTKIVAKATTVRILPGSELAVLDFLTNIEPGQILVVDAGGSGPAVWGQMATEIALKKELKGVIVHGGVKDINKIREKGLPCYTSTITPITEAKQSLLLEETSVKIGEVTIETGDWLVGDDTGIVCISKEKVFSKVQQAFDLYNKRIKVIKDIENSKDKNLKDIIERYKELYIKNT